MVIYVLGIDSDVLDILLNVFISICNNFRRFIDKYTKVLTILKVRINKTNCFSLKVPFMKKIL